MSDLINEPDASRLIFALRDTGYNFRTAAADIIDNSIAADANVINVRIEVTTEGRKFVYFGDNGSGMDASELRAAMQYGAPVRENLASLGKFGLGLKTASSSICKHYAILSRKNQNEKLNKLAWDLEHVERTGQWEMRRDDLEPHEVDAFEELCGGSGTLVIWSNCDRLLSKNYDEPGGSREQQALKRLRSSLGEHLGVVYHRFLDEGDDRARDIQITINDAVVDGWNPFYPEKSEQVLSDAQTQIPLEDSDGDLMGTAHIKAWILPHRNSLTTDERKKANITNRGQGFYIYRHGRLINQGGWLGVFGSQGTLEPHMSLLRIEFDFGYELDEALFVDVKKSQILFDPALEDYLQTLLSNARREAENRYRRKEKEKLVKAGVSHGPSNTTIGATNTARKPTINGVDSEQQTASITNTRGQGIQIRQPVHSNVSQETIYVEAVDTIKSGILWEPALRSSTESGHQPAVHLNKHHDFYQKIYLRAQSNGYSLQGMDLLLWALAVAEMDNSNEEVVPILEDIRDLVSSNLKKLLRDITLPDDIDLGHDGDA